MAKTVENVLVGVGTLFVRNPNNAKASWSDDDPRTGSWSAKLYKGGLGSDGSTHVQLTPPNGITMAAFADALDTNSFYCKNQAINRNWENFEFRFEDPNSNAWVEFSFVAIGQAEDGLGIWEKATLSSADSEIGMQGETEIGTDFSSWALTATLSEHIVVITALNGDTCAPEDWILKRVRVELWEMESSVYLQDAWCLIEDIEVMGTTYTIEPGGTAPGLKLNSAYTEVGYTEDGVTFEVVTDTADIVVAEETVAIKRFITKETIRVSCVLAETTLANLNLAIGGGVLSGNILTIGGGVLKEMNLRFEGTNPEGYDMAIDLPKVTATGTVGMSFKKDEKTMFPVSFEALKPQGEQVCSVVYNAA